MSEYVKSPLRLDPVPTRPESDVEYFRRNLFSSLELPERMRLDDTEEWFRKHCPLSAELRDRWEAEERRQDKRRRG